MRSRSWVKKQTAHFIEQTSGRDAEPAKLVHDRDTKFDRAFRQQLSSANIEPIKLPKKSPNLNGRCERFILTIKQELLSKFLVFGKRHLDHLMDEFVDYYNKTRSHSARESLPPIRVVPDEAEEISPEQVGTRTYLGGLITSFERKAA